MSSPEQVGNVDAADIYTFGVELLESVPLLRYADGLEYRTRVLSADEVEAVTTGFLLFCNIEPLAIEIRYSTDGITGPDPLDVADAIAVEVADNRLVTTYTIARDRTDFSFSRDIRPQLMTSLDGDVAKDWGLTTAQRRKLEAEVAPLEEAYSLGEIDEMEYRALVAMFQKLNSVSN